MLAGKTVTRQQEFHHKMLPKSGQEDFCKLPSAILRHHYMILLTEFCFAFQRVGSTYQANKGLSDLFFSSLSSRFLEASSGTWEPLPMVEFVVAMTTPPCDKLLVASWYWTLPPDSDDTGKKEEASSLKGIQQFLQTSGCVPRVLVRVSQKSRKGSTISHHT